MKKFDVQIALEGIAEAKGEWAKAIRKFNADVERALVRLLHEASANYMSVEEVARHSGLSPKRVRTLMRDHGLNPRLGKRVLADSAAKALHENAALMGIRPHDMDLMSPLAYLPMGSKMRQELTDKAVSKVTELPDESIPPAERECQCKVPLPSGSLNYGVEICLWCSYRIVSGNVLGDGTGE